MLIILMCHHVLIVPLISTLTGIENSQERKISTQGASSEDVNLLLYSGLSLCTLIIIVFSVNIKMNISDITINILVTSPTISSDITSNK